VIDLSAGPEGRPFARYVQQAAYTLVPLQVRAPAADPPARVACRSRCMCMCCVWAAPTGGSRPWCAAAPRMGRGTAILLLLVT